MLVPLDLAAALNDVPAALKRWGKLPQAHRREYLEWIEDAEKLETGAADESHH